MLAGRVLEGEAVNGKDNPRAEARGAEDPAGATGAPAMGAA
jgi:hypothetical protein